MAAWLRARAGAEDAYLYLVFFLLSAAQALPITATALVLNDDLGMRSRPEALNAYFAVEFSLSALKPAWAALSDLAPIRGKRRVPYMVLGALSHALALQFYARVRTIAQLYAAGVAASLTFAMCESGADGMLVQLGGGDASRAMNLQARGMTARNLGGLVASALSVPALLWFSPRTVMSLAGVVAVAAAMAASRAREEASAPAPAPAAGGDGPSFVPVRGDEEDGEGDDEASDGGRRDARRRRGRWTALASRRVVCAAGFIFLSRVAPTAGVTYDAFAYSVFALPNWAFSGLLLVSTFASVLASWAYDALSRRGGVDLGATALLGACVDAACGLTRVSVATAAARGASSSTRRRAPAPALIASALASSFGMTLNYVPTLALAAAAAPRGLEAVGYSSLVCVADAATAIGSVVAARATTAFRLGDPGASPGSSGGRSWKDLDVFVWTCAGCKLLPLLALPLVARVVGDAKPRRGARGDEDDDEDEDDRGGDGSEDDDVGDVFGEDGDDLGARLLTRRGS